MCVNICTGLGKRKFTVVHIENNTIIKNNNRKMNSAWHTQKYKPTLLHVVYTHTLIHI